MLRYVFLFEKKKKGANVQAYYFFDGLPLNQKILCMSCLGINSVCECRVS